MSHTPHELADEFPQDRDLIHRLKQDDAHFARLADEYHTVNRTIHRIESETEAASDERMESLKKERLALADQISATLAKARTPA
ncbi:MAG: YdcH family protein [Sphingomonadaceae bacterium]|nr:YdcH family protein [Sphingomonadaceae bacterium]